MAGNPVLGFLNVRPTGSGPHATVTRMLRLLGIIVLIGAAFSVINTVLMVAMGTAYYGVAGAAIGGAAFVGLVFGLAITAAVLFWITFTITAWTTNDARGPTHTLVIAIIATVLGGLSVLFGLTGGLLTATAYPTYMLVNVVSLLISAAEVYCGVMILTNRSKATGTGANAAGTTN
ncbi:MAG: hypothetical protein ACYC2H_11515 [Thermoplasmatota archaeon]